MQGLLTMSRVGRQHIIIPPGTTVISESNTVVVSGAKGKLDLPLLEGISISQEGDKLKVLRTSDEAKDRANHGLTRSLINNMVIGVSTGFSKQLELVGVGYRVSLQGNTLKLSLGYSHDITFVLPEGVNASIEQNIITISGISKQLVGQAASDIRSLRKPEPYKGKGIRYVNEYIIRKSGKSGKEK